MSKRALRWAALCTGTLLSLGLGSCGMGGLIGAGLLGLGILKNASGT